MLFSVLSFNLLHYYIISCSIMSNPVLSFYLMYNHVISYTICMLSFVVKKVKSILRTMYLNRNTSKNCLILHTIHLRTIYLYPPVSTLLLVSICTHVSKNHVFEQKYSKNCLLLHTIQLRTSYLYTPVSALLLESISVHTRQ